MASGENFRKSLDIVRQMEYNIIGGDFMDRERLQIRITAELAKKIDEQAEKLGVNRSEFCRIAIIQYITREGGAGASTTTNAPEEINNQ